MAKGHESSTDMSDEVRAGMAGKTGVARAG
jgi:hypothetical protein